MKKCPFCGSRETEIHREHDRSVHSHGEFYYWTECRGCDAKGPITSEHCFAEMEWNKRPCEDELLTGKKDDIEWHDLSARYEDAQEDLDALSEELKLARMTIEALRPMILEITDDHRRDNDCISDEDDCGWCKTVKEALKIYDASRLH